MFDVLQENIAPAYLDVQARELLKEGRDAFRRLNLNERSCLALNETETLLFPWQGTVATQTLALALISEGLSATPRNVAVEVKAPLVDVEQALASLAGARPPDPVELATFSRNLVREKFHPYLSRELLEYDAASVRIEEGPVPEIARRLLAL